MNPAVAAAQAQAAQAMAAQQGYGQPPQQNPGAPPGYGAPQQPPGYGVPPQGYGAPPQGYGQPPPGYGQPPPGYGAPPQYGQGAPGYGAPQGYGQPPQQGYGAAPGQAAGYGAGAIQPAQVYGAVQQGFAQAGAAMGIPQGAVKPTRRNALMTFLMPMIIIFGAVIVSIVFGVIASATDVPILAMVGGAVSGLGVLAGSIIALISIIRMIGELNSVTKSNAVGWWMLFIPIFNIYVSLILIPNEVTKAKQMVGAREPTRNLLVYWFLALYALAADLNDIAAAMPA
jgi:hypothetical protein